MLEFDKCKRKFTDSSIFINSVCEILEIKSYSDIMADGRYDFIRYDRKSYNIGVDREVYESGIEYLFKNDGWVFCSDMYIMGFIKGVRVDTIIDRRKYILYRTR